MTAAEFDARWEEFTAAYGELSKTAAGDARHRLAVQMVLERLSAEPVEPNAAQGTNPAASKKDTPTAKSSVPGTAAWLARNQVRIHLTPPPSADVSPVREALVREVRQSFRGHADFQESAASMPHRMTGTAEGRRAEEFVFDKLKSYGLSARYHEFDMLIWRRKSAALTIRPGESDRKETEQDPAGSEGRSKDDGDNAGTLTPATESFAYTPARSDVRAELIDVGDGLAEDFAAAGAALRGKIALVNLHIMDPGRLKPGAKKRGNPHRSTRAAMAMRYGAVGVIFVNKYPGGVLTTGTVSKNDAPIKIPALCIARDDGAAIRALGPPTVRSSPAPEPEGNDGQDSKSKAADENEPDAEKSRDEDSAQKRTEPARKLFGGQPVLAHIEAESETERIRARNVIGMIPGLELPHERVIVGGHLDTWDLSVGAIDNGIGAFAVLDMARAMRAAGVVPLRTLEFVFWMGEEQGLVGSLAFIKDEAHAGRLDDIRLYVNIDMHGNPQGFDTEGRSELRPFFKETTRRIRELGIDFPGRRRNSPSLFSDNVPFAVQGIPVMQMISQLDGRVYAYYHSNQDHMELADPEHMRRSSLIMSQALLHLGKARDLPARRLSKEDTRRLFVRYGISGVLSKRGFHLRD